jgi:hypothetical protein
MRFVVEQWSPEYGAPVDIADDGQAQQPDVDLTVELAPADWAPVTPPPAARPETVLFIDGVRRIDARVWPAEPEEGLPAPAICASYAAGTVCCRGDARIIDARVERAVIGSAFFDPIDAGALGVYERRAVAGKRGMEDLMNGLQQAMRDLEIRVAKDAPAADLVVVDGPLIGREDIPGAVGYVKTHQAQYLVGPAASVVGALGAGQRTPVFLAQQQQYSRFSWYLRLAPAAGHPWSGIVRCEVAGTLSRDSVIAVANTTAITLPGFASTPFRDPRAPQNLYPVAGLERELRHRLGDPLLAQRALVRAARLSEQ